MSTKSSVTFLGAITILAIIISHLGRMLSEQLLSERISVIGSTIGFQLMENAGVAFGLSIPSPLLEILIGVILILFIILAYRARNHRIPSVGFGLIIGGALANVIDRLDDGFVTDFIQIGWWPTFNIADSCITVGAVVLIVAELLKSKTVKQ